MVSYLHGLLWHLCFSWNDKSMSAEKKLLAKLGKLTKLTNNNKRFNGMRSESVQYNYVECVFLYPGTFILLRGDLSSLRIQFKRNPLPANLFYTYSHSFRRACGVLWILWAWWAMMMSFCSTSPPRRRSMQWGLRDPEPWSDEPSSWSHGTSKLAARGGRPRYSGTAWGTCREQERAPCERPWRAAGIGILQASGSGRDREDRACISLPEPHAERRLGERERERDWSELVSISAAVDSWRVHHNAAAEKKRQKKMRGTWKNHSKKTVYNIDIMGKSTRLTCTWFYKCTVPYKNQTTNFHSEKCIEYLHWASSLKTTLSELSAVPEATIAGLDEQKLWTSSHAEIAPIIVAVGGIKLRTESQSNKRNRDVWILPLFSHMFCFQNTEHSTRPVKPCCCCHCPLPRQKIEKYGVGEVASMENSKFKASRLEAHKTRLFPMSWSWEWENWSRGTVTHSSAAGLLRHELDTVWVELCPSNAAQRSSKSLERLRGQRAHSHGWLDPSVAADGQAASDFSTEASSEDMWYLLLSVGFAASAVGKWNVRHLYQQTHLKKQQGQHTGW